MNLRANKFPFAEGVGIFVGILAWDLLSEGRLNIVKSLAISIPCTLVWFAIRCWNSEPKDRPH